MLPEEVLSKTLSSLRASAAPWEPLYQSPHSGYGRSIGSPAHIWISQGRTFSSYRPPNVKIIQESKLTQPTGLGQWCLRTPHRFLSGVFQSFRWAKEPPGGRGALFLSSRRCRVSETLWGTLWCGSHKSWRSWTRPGPVLNIGTSLLLGCRHDAQNGRCCWTFLAAVGHIVLTFVVGFVLCVLLLVCFFR